MKPSLPLDEEERLASLQSYDILDSPAEPEYDRIVQLAAHLFNVPTATITLVDAKRQWFKARVGLRLHQTCREQSFCGHTILGHESMVIPDTSLDVRFADNPLVKGEPRVRFYAGAPLITPGGHKLGALCLMDSRPRRFGPAKQEMLESLAAMVVDTLQLRKTARENRKMAAVIESTFTPVVTLDPTRLERPITYANPAFLQMTGYRREEVLGRSPLLLQGPETDPDTIQEIRAAIAEHRPFHGRIVCYRKDGSKFCSELAAKPVFDRQGQLVHYVGLQRNVTEEQRAAEALQQGEARFRWVAANEPGMIYQWITYRDSTPREYRFVSEGCRDLFGVEPAAVMSEPDFLFYHLPENERPGFARSVAQAAEALQDWHWEGRLLTPENHAKPERWVQIKARPVRLPGGDLLWDGLIVDLTEHRQAEFLRRAKEDAERSNRLKDEFLECLGRKLHHPLNTILEFNRALEIHPDLGGDRSDLPQVLEAGRELDRIVREATSLMKSGAEHPPAYPVDLALPASATILYIEDHLPNIQLVERLLAKYPQVRLLTATQASVGLALARQHRPSLILLDVHLPDLSGDQVLTRLRQQEETRRIPVVVISADSTLRQLDKMNRAGASAYLTKPLDVQDFLRTVNSVLVNAPAASEMAAGAHGQN